MDEDTAAEPTQQTQPKGRDKDGKPYEPVEIPVPKRSTWDRLLQRAENTAPPRPTTGETDEKPRSP